MTTLERPTPRDEGRPTLQLSLGTMRGAVIVFLALLVWAGSTCVAAGAVFRLMGEQTLWGWVICATATIPAALSALFKLDKLIEPSVQARALRE